MKPLSSARHWSWLTLLVVVLIGTAAVVSTPATHVASAQPGGEAGAPGEGGEPAGEGGDDKKDDGEGGGSLLMYIISSSGVFGIILLLLSFVMVALIVMNLLQVRRDNLMPPDFLDDFENFIKNKEYQKAYEMAKTDESTVARVLTAGLGRLNRGYAEAVEGMQEVGEEETMGYEHRLSWLAQIGAIAPMIGLMGTVYGMIDSFMVIKDMSSQPEPKQLAKGISTALVSTLEGLIVAIPAIIFYGFLRNRVARLMMEVGIESETLMSSFQQVGKREGGKS